MKSEYTKILKTAVHNAVWKTGHSKTSIYTPESAPSVGEKRLITSWSAVTSPKESLPHIDPKKAAQPSINKKHASSFINLVPCVFFRFPSSNVRYLFTKAYKTSQM